MSKEKKFNFDIFHRSHERITQGEKLETEIENYFGIESAKTSSLYILTIK